MNKTVVLVGALDTKGEEFAFVRELVTSQGLKTLVVDFGVLGQPAFRPDITREEVARSGGGDLEHLRSGQHKDEAIHTKRSCVFNQTGLATHNAFYTRKDCDACY